MQLFLTVALLIGACLAFAFVLMALNIVLTDRRRVHHTCDYRMPPCVICQRRHSEERG